MRTLPFREVLHSVADKMGLDPEQSNFLTNQAVPIGKSIDQWIRRTYDSVDFPEWTRTIPVHVNSDHMVSYDPLVSGQVNDIPIHIYRVLNVYLVDPSTTDAPIETEFTLQPEGIHVGFDHGTTVWIKYIEPAPRYTAEQWRPERTFAKDDITYSDFTGEVYKSKINNNTGHDPAILAVDNVPAPPLLIEVVQDAAPAEVGLPETPKIIDFALAFSGGATIPNPPPTGTQFSLALNYDDGTLIAYHFVSGNGVKTLATLLTDLRDLFDADALFNGFIFTVDTVNLKLRVEGPIGVPALPDFGVRWWNWQVPAGQPQYPLAYELIQGYVPEVTAVQTITQQQLKISFNADQLIPGGLYTMEFRGLDGITRTVEFQSELTDNDQRILSGMMAAVNSVAATDDFYRNILLILNTTDPSLLVNSDAVISVDAFVTVPASPYWEYVPFPRTLANTVIRGAYADLLKEWGQADKGAGEEQAVPSETTIAAGKFQGTPATGLTDQQQPLSRYRIQ